MASFAAGGRKNLDITSEQVADLVGYFPGEFKSRCKLIVRLLIHTKLGHLKIDLDEREGATKLTVKLLNCITVKITLRYL